MPAPITNNVLSAHVPALIVPPTPKSLAAVLAGTQTPATAKKWVMGQVDTVAYFNHNAALAEMAMLYGAPTAYALPSLPGHAPQLSATGTDLILHISAGYALIGGPVEIPTARTLALANGHDGTGTPPDRIWIWLQQNGTPIDIMGTTDPPTPNAVLLGSVTTSGGVITGIDTSGVYYAQVGGLYRQTGDAGAPTDTLPSHVNVLTQTASGMYRWNGPAGSHVTDTPYDIGWFATGRPSTSQVVLLFVAPRAISLPSALAGSIGKAGTAATAQTDFDVKKNGVSVGTVRFAAAGTVASFIAASPISLAAGDILKVVAPGTQDATLADIAVTFKGTF